MTTCPTAEEATGIARWIESRGWKPTPLHVVGPDGKTCSCPKGGNCGRSAGKHNIAGGWQNDHRGVEIFLEMAQRRKRMNIGILTGDVSGIFVLDIDPNDGGFESMKALVEQHGKMPQTFIAKTGTGGYHYYFRMPDFDVRNSAKKLAKGIDIRGNGGMVVAPGSVSYAGPYQIQFDAPVAPAPAWLLEMLRPAAPAARPMCAGIHDAVMVNGGETRCRACGAIWTDNEWRPAAPEADPFAAMPADAVSDPAAPVAISAPASAAAGQQTRQEAAYETSIVTGELRRVASLQAAGWNQPWDITTFEVACQLVELANAPWTRLTLDEAYAQFIAACPPAEPGYDPTAKWQSAVQRVAGKQRPAPAPQAVPEDPFDGWETTGGTPGPSMAAGANREGTPTAGPFSLTDLGNAERLIAHHGDVVRYAADAETWITYDRGVWSEATGEVDVEAYVKSAIEIARNRELFLHSDIPMDPEAKTPKSPRDEFLGWMGKSEFYARIQATAKMARSDMRVRTSMSLFDADPMMFNAANCAINLATGQAVTHSPSLMFRHQSHIAYNPAAQCPMWLAFLERTQPDPEMRDWLQRVLGYSLTGRMDEHAIFIHNGPGATGKTTFLEVINAVMGDYGQKLDRETLLSKPAGNSTVPADIARMAGARFLAASETATGRKLDDERVKELVGGDTQSARHLYGKWFDFRPTGKIHMATNHLPGFESGGDGMGRRFRLVPWEVQIPKEEQDKTLKDRIIAQEAEGVLAWLVRGAAMWAASPGLVTPGEVQKRSEEHIEEADPVWPFIHERLERGDEYAAEFQQVYGAYDSWCSLNGNKPMSGRAFSMALRERLGADSKFLDNQTRRSMFRVRVRLAAVPEYHQQYAKGL